MGEITIKLMTLEIESAELTKRKALYKGFFGKIKCVFRWISDLFSGNRVKFKTWLDQNMTYVIDFDIDINDYQNIEVNDEVQKSLEDLLKTELEKIE